MKQRNSSSRRRLVMTAWMSVAFFSVVGFFTAAVLLLAPHKMTEVINELSAHGSDYKLPTQSQSSLDSRDSAEVKALRGFSKVFVNLAKQAKPAVVFLQVSKKTEGRQVAPFFGLPEEFFGRGFQQPRIQRGAGSGFIVDLEKGYVITNNHVIDGAESIKIVTVDEQEYEGKVVGGHKDSDVAVVQFSDLSQLDKDAVSQATFGDSDLVEVGEWVVALGAPFQLPQTLTVGVVSALGRERIIGGRTALEDFIQTDASINPGNSGGPLLNLDGQVIGINTAISSSSGSSAGIGFAVPSNIARRIAESLINTGTVIRGFIGITGQDAQLLSGDMLEKIGASPGQKGAIVYSVIPESPGEASGLKPYDIIVELEGEPLKNFSELRTRIAFVPPGTAVDLKVLRQGKELDLKLVVGNSDDFDGDGAPSESQSRAPSAASERFGFSLRALNDSLKESYRVVADQGVLITEVAPRGLADRFGFRVGDIIIEINRSEVTDPGVILKAFEEAESNGNEVLVLIERDRRNQLVVVSLK